MGRDVSSFVRKLGGASKSQNQFTKSIFDFFLDLIKSKKKIHLYKKWLSQIKFTIFTIIFSEKGTFSYNPIYLHLIFAIYSLMNWIFSRFQTWILQATAGKPPIHQTEYLNWIFQNQVQINWGTVFEGKNIFLYSFLWICSSHGSVSC